MMHPLPSHPVELNSPRLLLRGMDVDFLHRLFREWSKEEIVNYMGLDENSYRRYQEMHEQGMKSYRHSHFLFLIIDKSTQCSIGEAGFHSWNTYHRRAELFYMLRSEAFRNLGLMSEALPFILDFGFQTLALNRVQALVADNNTASLKLLRKFAFKFEGTNRQDFLVEEKFEDSLQYSLLAEEWLSRP